MNVLQNVKVQPVSVKDLLHYQSMAESIVRDAASKLCSSQLQGHYIL